MSNFRLRLLMDIEGIRPAVRRHTPAHVAPAAVVAPVQTALPPEEASPAVELSDLELLKDYPLPRYEPPKRPSKFIRKRSKLKRAIWSGAAALLLLVLGTGGFLSWRTYANLHKVFHGSGAVATLSTKPVAPDLLKGEGDGRVNILLLGIGGPGHQGPDLTDTIVVLSIDPVNNTASMLSIPRDLWVQQPVNYFGKQQKINAAYESAKYHTVGHLDASNKNTVAVQAGFDNIDQVVKTVLGVNINYHVLVNFQAFKQAVDTVGGVTVDVPTDLVDPTMAWENHWNSVLAKAGVQQMNGVQALMYARSRETSSDFARAERQRQILVALKDKVFTLGTIGNPAAINGLLNTFGDNVYSDLSTQGATRLYGIMKHIGDQQVTSLGLTDDKHKLVTTDHMGTTSVVRPIAGFYNYTAIQAYVRQALPDGYLIKEHAPIEVVAPTQAAATAAADQLKSYGYNVTVVATTSEAVPTTSVINLSHDDNPYTLHYLENHYKVQAVDKLPAGFTADPSAEFVIMVAT